MGKMEKKIKTVVFDRVNDDGFDKDISQVKMQVGNWIHYKKKNEEDLKEMLQVDHLPNIHIKLHDLEDIRDGDDRLIIYKSKNCHISELDLSNESHCIQVSFQNKKDRENWIEGERDFSAKVFINSKEDAKRIVEDVLLDIQVFYSKSLDVEFDNIEKRREFSRFKAEYVKRFKLNCYLGECRDAEYVSFASFCRNDYGIIQYDKYNLLWNDFIKWLNEKQKYAVYKDGMTTIKLKKKHPKGGQISYRRLNSIVSALDNGRYCLIRTEKNPKKSRNRREILSRFGLSKWKTGRIKVVPIKDKYTWKRMVPYISIFEFSLGEDML